MFLSIALLSKKSFQNVTRGRKGFKENVKPMMGAGVLMKRIAQTQSPTLGITCTIDHPCNPCLLASGEAHRTRLEGYNQRRPGQPPAFHPPCGCLESHDLSMSTWVIF